MAIDLNGSTGISLDDNEKINIGNDSDLQIYHDGSNSYIDDTASGSLVIRGSTVYLQKYTGEYMLDAVADGAVTLYHNNASKLSTTSTGIDVTGTVTVGDGHTIGNDASDNLKIVSSSGENLIMSTGDDFFVHAGSDTRRLKIDNSGDISFYEDTGTTAKFFWDASAESLGIGTSSPSSSYKVTIDNDTSMIRMNHTGTGTNGTLDLGVNSTVATIIANYNTTPIDLRFLTGAQERMRILSGGGITFNGDTAAANALSDYEEGTWTPAVHQAGFTISSGFTARYTKIGRLVTVICDCNLSGTGNGNDMKISGLPFTSLSLGHSSGAGYTETYPSAQNGSNAAFVPKSGNNDTFVYFQNGNGARYDGDRFSAGFLNFTITYFTS